MNPATNRFSGWSYRFCGRVDLLQLPLPDHRHPVAHGHRLDLIVGDVDGGDVQVVLDPRDLGTHLDAELGVQVRQRLVHQERLGLADDRPAHGHPLPLAARQRLRLALEQVLESEDVPRLPDPAIDLLFRELAELEPERHVVVHGHVRVQRVVLEHHRDVALLRRHGVDHPVVDGDRAAADALEARDHPKSRRLPAAGRAHQDDELAVLDVEVEVGHGERSVRVLLGHGIQHDLCHRSPFGRTHEKDMRISPPAAATR